MHELLKSVEVQKLSELRGNRESKTQKAICGESMKTKDQLGSSANNAREYMKLKARTDTVSDHAMPYTAF